jgi:hypothetical protein
MEGDFTRNSDEAEAGYSGVLMQQGRVQLDADWNEQWAIATRALRAALRDLIGPHGGPQGRVGLAIESDPEATRTLTVGAGVYYVDGIRSEARGGEQAISMAGREDGVYLAFLDLWERHVNAIEDPRIREVALLGPDTASRAEVVWRVRLLDVSDVAPDVLNATAADQLVETYLRQRPRRRLAARARTVNPDDDPCKLPPSSMYRGRENQLYRVQIHDALPENPPGTRDPVLFTYKWSRDNGSVVFPIVQVAAPEPGGAAGDNEIAVTVTLGDLGREARFGLVAGDIVEFVHDALGRGMLDPEGERSPGDADEIAAGGPDPGRSGLLGRVLAVDPDAMTVRVAVYAPDLAEIAEGTLHPYLRRWDQRDEGARKLHLGAVPVTQADLGAWLPLERGVEIRFEAPPAQPQRPPEQRAGDHWQIPARVATGDVLWPRNPSVTPPADPAALVPPHGPQHHYAPLAFVSVPAGTIIDVRRRFGPLAG